MHTVPAVGFQVIESTVNESVARKFACVEILSGGPLPSEAVIEFYTRDGSAVGKCTIIILCIIHIRCTQCDHASMHQSHRL